jgi:A/G-specific adenine glycosylase
MLQQTTVATVIPYFERFLERWPTLADLAKASLEEVLHLWQGLGYYSRARNLHRCAQEIVNRFQGLVPSSEKDLKSLPGIGDYTAAAIRSIAFQKPSVVMDGNIERIMARLFLVKDPLPAAKAILKEHARTLSPTQRPGDYAQALMDIGATLCTPQSPQCSLCPLQPHCKAFGKNPERYPQRVPKKVPPRKQATLFWIEDENGYVLVEKRPEKGLLGGLMGFPTSPWEETNGPSPLPLPGPWISIPEEVTHTFTHFHLTLSIMQKTLQKREATVITGQWILKTAFKDYAFPTLMKKVIRTMERAKPL